MSKYFVYYGFVEILFPEFGATAITTPTPKKSTAKFSDTSRLRIFKIPQPGTIQLKMYFKFWKKYAKIWYLIFDWRHFIHHPWWIRTPNVVTQSFSLKPPCEEANRSTHNLMSDVAWSILGK